ncbi:hypothetical protein C8Q78DRAFT_631910 [Trametes maxima]|nr:hypothetical protein C8Q78DRAFT_631910 [Trametes maxima]
MEGEKSRRWVFKAGAELKGTMMATRWQPICISTRCAARLQRAPSHGRTFNWPSLFLRHLRSYERVLPSRCPRDDLLAAVLRARTRSLAFADRRTPQNTLVSIAAGAALPNQAKRSVARYAHSPKKVSQKICPSAAQAVQGPPCNLICRGASAQRLIHFQLAFQLSSTSCLVRLSSQRGAHTTSSIGWQQQHSTVSQNPHYWNEFATPANIEQRLMINSERDSNAILGQRVRMN